MLCIIIILDEELIKWGWPEDVWFHVDKLSSAHVYLRLKEVKEPCRNIVFDLLTYNVKVIWKYGFSI